MSVDKVIKTLDDSRQVLESYVLLREMRLFLDVGHEHFHPRIRIKIYKSAVLPSAPYHFEVSHNVHTPEQTGPYFSSITSAESEEEAISQAISTTTTFLTSAIRMGHEPSDSWLILNKEF